MTRPDDPVSAVIRHTDPAAVLAALRPRQWTKNALVFAAPLGAGVLLRPAVLLDTAAAFVALCLAASGSYLLNDVVDVDADRAHPAKRHRPIAAGRVSTRTAVGLALLLLVAGVALGFVVRVELGVTVVGYLAVTTAYSLLLKREPVVELALLALGFLLRAVAGGAAADVPLSAWFLLVAAFGALFMAAGKRASELARASTVVASDAAALPPASRPSLAGYTAGYLRFVWQLAATVTVVGYCLWALQVDGRPSTLPWAAFSVLPFVLGVLRYAAEIDRGDAEAPEAVVLRDTVLLVLGAVWALLVGLGAYGV